jgi:hypothetical protein
MSDPVRLPVSPVVPRLSTGLVRVRAAGVHLHLHIIISRRPPAVLVRPVHQLELVALAIARHGINVRHRDTRGLGNVVAVVVVLLVVAASTQAGMVVRLVGLGVVGRVVIAVRRGVVMVVVGHARKAALGAVRVERAAAAAGPAVAAVARAAARLAGVVRRVRACAIVAAALAAAARREEAWPQPLVQRRDARHARAHDAHVNLDERPHGERRVVVGWVGARAKLHDGVQPDDGAGRDARVGHYVSTDVQS